MNSWNIPIELERQIRNRDKKCVYCGKDFKDDETIEQSFKADKPVKPVCGLSNC